jgi:hypothetical protein
MPHDIFGVSLCRLHHGEHRIGARAFNEKYSIDLWALAAEFVRRSPDGDMRALLRIIPADAASDARSEELELMRRSALSLVAIAPTRWRVTRTRPCGVATRWSASTVTSSFYLQTGWGRLDRRPKAEAALTDPRCS